MARPLGPFITAFASLIFFGSLLPANAKRYPPPRDEVYSFQSICELGYVKKRVPVYRAPSVSAPPIFFMPKNYGVCISGAFNGWGYFGRFREAAFFREFWEVVPDHGVDYGWIRLSDVRPGRAVDGACTLRRRPNAEDRFEFPSIKNENGTNLCPTSFELASDSNAVVLFWHRHHVGKTYRSVEQSSLNKCVKICRDNPQCSGLSYVIAASRCDLKNGGGINFEAPEEFDGTISAVKLID